MLIGDSCPMCGRFVYLKITKEQDKQYTDYCCYGGVIQEKLNLFDKFEREFLKTGYCPNCQCELFHTNLPDDNKFFYNEEMRAEAMTEFMNAVDGLKPADAIMSSEANKLTVNEKLLYIYEFDLEKELTVDEITGEVHKIEE